MKDNVLSAEDIKNAVSEQIKAARHEKGLTVRQAAGRLGISPSYLSQIENAERNLSLEILFKASQVYNVKVDVLLGREKLAGSGGKRVFDRLAGFFKTLVPSEA